jgi:MSHA biogenesis protein MshJ
MKLSANLTALSTWYEQRPLRERLMLFVCLLAVLFFLWDLTLQQPLNKRQKLLRTEASDIQSRLTDLEAREQAVTARRNFDPDLENRRRLEILQAEWDRLRDQLADNVVQLISPQEMPELLKDLLLRQEKLQLLSLENLPAEPLNIQAGAADNPLFPGLYRHRLRIEFAGDFLSTLSYLRELEQLPRHLVWKELAIETQDYPRAIMRLEVFTLSFTEGWIGG